MSKKPTTLADIARLAGVAPSTVSRVLNSKSTRVKVSDERAAMIRDIAARHDYIPNVNAWRLWSKRSGIIGLSIPTHSYHKNNLKVFNDPAFMEMMRGLELTLPETANRLMLVFQNDKYFEEREYLRMFKTRELDGLLIWGSQKNEEYIAEIADFPTVVLSSHPDIQQPFEFIGIDNFNGIYNLVNDFIQRGFRNFAYLGDTDGTFSIIRERYNGFVKALEDADLPPALLIRQPWRGIPVLDDGVLEKLRNIEVLVCFNDNLVFRTYQILTAQGIMVPDDLILLGADGLRDHSEGTFQHPTIRLPAMELGRQAVRRVIELIKNPDSPRQRSLLMPEIIIPAEMNSCRPNNFKES